MKPRLLDLFCGAGGAAMGYSRAGFEVVGVDNRPQPHYPFEFVQGDALDALTDLYLFELHRFAAVHASPPCQRFSDLAHRNGNKHEHPDLIGPTRELLELTGVPYVIENVEGAPLRSPQTICGSAIPLTVIAGTGWYRLRRHRLFETNWTFAAPPCDCRWALEPVMDVSGGGPSHAPRKDGAGGRTYKGTADEVRRLMQMPWATKAECNQAIPPAYTELIGHQLMQHLKATA